MKTVFVGLLLVVALLAGAVAPAYAAEDVTVEGSVTAIDEVSGTFTLTAEDETVYTVTPPEDFDLTMLTVGSQVEVFGDSDELGGFAAENVTILDVTVEGNVTAIDEVSGTFTLTTEDETVYSVTPPEDFDWTTLTVGSQVEVFGDSDGLGGFAAESVTILSSGEEPSDEDGQNSGFYCSNPEVMHPALQRVAENYSAEYVNVLAMFCGGGLGVGGVNHALNASAASGVGMDEILAMRAEMGWGQIWKALGLLPNENETEADPEAESAHPSSNGRGQGNGNGNGQGNGRGPNN